MSDFKVNLGTHLAQQKIFVDDDDRIKRPQDLNLYGCQALATAVAKMAAEDWRKAVRHELKTGKVGPFNVRRECERFFRSEWFKTLTGVDGNYVLQELRREFGNDGKRIF